MQKIVVRSPLRLCLGGGGTDLPSYYQRHSGFVISAAINKYVSVSIRETEVVDEESRNPIIREALKLFSPEPLPLEITSMSDVPPGTGLGSSGSFTTALLKALHIYMKRPIADSQLAELACEVEINRLKEPIGKQDQYIATYGGIRRFQFLEDGTVESRCLEIPKDGLQRLEENLLLFYTGQTRSASAILADQEEQTRRQNGAMLENLHAIKELACEIEQVLELGQIDEFGELMNLHWDLKKRRSNGITNLHIDECYRVAIQNGAIGGKLVGAGGGGFLMFLAGDPERLRAAMQKRGLQEVEFTFESEGTKELVQ